MTEQNISEATGAERRLAREWAKSVEATKDTWNDTIRAAARVILEAVPPPPRPTLADLTDEERAACQWMQADVANRTARYVIVHPHNRHGEAVLIDDDGGIDWVFSEYVTPRPDLRRMEWPGTEKPAPALPDGWRLADHRKYGRVIVTNTTTAHDGYVYYLHFSDRDARRFDWDSCGPDELTYIDQETDQ